MPEADSIFDVEYIARLLSDRWLIQGRPLRALEIGDYVGIEVTDEAGEPDIVILEALVVVPKGQPLAGTLIAISERGLDPQGNIIAFLVGGPSPGPFAVRRTNNFDVSDAVLLANGDLLILERKFSWLAGIGIRIRRIPLKSIAPGAVVDGPSIFDADLGQEIDNMEGIDAHVTDEGDTVLTMVSDDNFALLQRTLLLQFTLVG